MFSFQKDCKSCKNYMKRENERAELLEKIRLLEEEEEVRREAMKGWRLADAEAKEPAKEQEIVHTRAIIGGKMYSTETAEKIGKIPSYIIDNTKENDFLLFKTQNGNQFVCEERSVTYRKPDGYLRRVTEYHSIRVIDLEKTKEIIGQMYPDLYIELFGEVEEA